MNEDIERILNTLKENYENIGGSYYPEDLFKPNDPKIIYDYIMELQEEVKRCEKGNVILDNEVDELQNDWNELKKWLESWLENDKHCYLAENPIDKCRCEVYKELLNKMQELEQGKDESN